MRDERRLSSPVVLVAVVALALATGPNARGAEFPEGAQKPFQFELSGVWASFDTQARIDYTRGGVLTAGTSIDFEKLLDIPVSKEFVRLNGYWHLSKHNYIEVGYEKLNREGRRILDESIVWGDVSYALGGQMDGVFNNTNIYLGWRYDMFSAENVRFYGGIGVSYTMIDASLSGNGTLTKADGTKQTGQFEKGFSINAPIPEVVLGAEGAISRHFTFGFTVRTLFLTVSDFSGGILQGGLNVKWYATSHFGVVGGADLSMIRLKKWVKENEIYSANYTFLGPRLGVVVAF